MCSKSPPKYLQTVREFLRQESENRIVQHKELPLYDCVAESIRCMLSNQPAVNIDTFSSKSNIRYIKSPSNIKKSVVNLLKEHSKELQPVIAMLVDNVHMQEIPNENLDKKFYEMIISDCKDGYNYQIYVKLLLYAVATCINTPIYILNVNEVGILHWTYYEPLFNYDGQPRSVLRYVTMYMSPMKTFFAIEQRDVSAEEPKATGLVGMYIKLLEDTPVLEIDVPNTLLALSVESKSALCSICSKDVIEQSCKLLKTQGLIGTEEFFNITAHRTSAKLFEKKVTDSPAAFKIVCQVLIFRRKKNVLAPFVDRWDSLVASCEYLKQFEDLITLDNAVYERNVQVSAFVNLCKIGGRELDERRKKITTTVIASSSFGIVSGALIIAGIVLAPVSFGTSLGLCLAGGTIGLGTGMASGTARVVEAAKQNTKVTIVKKQQIEMQEKENALVVALQDIERFFKTLVINTEEAEKGNVGKSRRGLLAVGSALRVTHGGVGIALASARVIASAATVSAAVLGPVSMALDIAFLFEAAHNKIKGDKTNAGEILKSMAETTEIKSKILNSTLRGNVGAERRMFNSV